MEIPVKLGIEELEEEYDSVFYEDIEAPKFVDLSAPDAARPTDDPSWFCLRIGCDQNHEQVDPEALHRDFFMRVMAARSPNVRLRKVISRSKQSSMLPKCPHSAPAKPSTARITRLSRATEFAEKMTMAKLKNHRICSMRDSPIRTKPARVEASSAKKSVITPRSKAVRPRHEPFLSVKHQKEPTTMAAASRGAVVKALFMNTPKDTDHTPSRSKAPMSEVCSKMRKLNMACREVPSRYLSQLTTPKIAKKCEETTAAKSVKRVQDSMTDGKKKNILGRSEKRVDAETAEGIRNGRENTAADHHSCTETARCDEERRGVLHEPRIKIQKMQPDDSDDNKENLSYVDQPVEQALSGSHRGGENIKQLENNENVPPTKVPRVQNRANAEQGGKLKKTTIQRPFRLRTDERQVLKEANPERKEMLTENNSMAVPKDENHRVMQIGRCRDGMGRNKPTCGENQNKQSTRAATGLLNETKTGSNSFRCNNARPAIMQTKGKTIEKSKRIARTTAPSSTRTASGSMAPSQTGKERKPTVKVSRVVLPAAA